MIENRRLLKRTRRKKTIVSSSNDRLSFVIVIVDKFQENAIRTILIENKCSAIFIKHGYGSADESIYESLHLVEKQKSIIFTLINDKDYPTIKETLLKRLDYSKYTKGIILKIDISSIIGKSIYNFFSHTGYVKEVK